MATRRQRIDRPLAELVLNRVQPCQRFLGREAIIRQERERSLQERERLPAVVALDDHVLRDATRPVTVARLDEDTIADQLLEATFFDTEETAYLIDGQHGDINTGHERKTTPFTRRTEVGASDNFAKTPIESSK